MKRAPSFSQKASVLALGVFAGLALGSMAGCVTEAAYAAPCAKHAAEAKTSCLAQRDRLMWPPRPVTLRDLQVRDVNVRAFARLAMCEAGPGTGKFGVRWNTPPSYRWQGGLGMYNRTHQSVDHPYGMDAGRMSWQEQMLVGERVRLRYGIHAWSAASCFGA